MVQGSMGAVLEVLMTAPGTLIAGRYRLVNKIAVGGMGSVWEARDELLHRPVAVKQLLNQPGLSQDQAVLARNRVIREARITARLHHAHAVTLYDVVEHDGYPCLIMEYVRSRSLSALLQEQGVLQPPYVARIGAEVAFALAAAHEVGIVHRDVKPGNVLITDDGSAKLTDFGISHAVGDVSLTSTGMVTGTPAYLAPEVARGGKSGFPADVFSLGATLYAALEGTPPFGDDSNSMALLYKVASGDVIPPQRCGPLTPLLLQMLASEPADRPAMIDVARSLAARQTVTSEPQSVAEQTIPFRLFESDPINQPSTAPSGPGSMEPRPPRQQQTSPARRKTMGTLVGVILAVILASAVLIGFQLFGPNSGQSANGPAFPVEQTAGSAAPLGTTVPTSPAASSAAPESGTTAPNSADLAGAITDYYTLVPANTDEGWARLTTSFQTGTARNRQYYQSFWDGVERVVVSDVTGVPPDAAEATITYYFNGGRVTTERTAYTLVPDNGMLKIDSSTVLSSHTG